MHDTATSVMPIRPVARPYCACGMASSLLAITEALAWRSSEPLEVGPESLVGSIWRPPHNRPPRNTSNSWDPWDRPLGDENSQMAREGRRRARGRDGNCVDANGERYRRSRRGRRCPFGSRPVESLRLLWRTMQLEWNVLDVRSGLSVSIR